MIVCNNFVCILPFSSDSITKEPLFFITFGFFNNELQSGLFLGSTYKSNFIISDKSELYLFGIGSYIPDYIFLLNEIKSEALKGGNVAAIS